MAAVGEVVAVVLGVALIVWGAEAFAEHLAGASTRLGVRAFALALLLAGAEPEELATSVTASLRYAALGVPIGIAAAAIAWDGRVTRSEGAVLVGIYAAYVAIIWLAERRPPALGETGELAEARERGATGRVGRELAFVVAGVGAMAIGAVLVVEAVRHLTHVESTQTRLGLTLVGFATAFELVVLAWSSARRGVSEAVVAGVVGSYAYNCTMTLGAGALVRPLHVADAAQLHGPWVAMVAALVALIAIAAPRRALTRPGGVALLVAYPLVVALVLAR